jgi:hypothetical protein
MIRNQTGAPERAYELVLKWDVTCARLVTLIVRRQLAFAGSVFYDADS